MVRNTCLTEPVLTDPLLMVRNAQKIERVLIAYDGSGYSRAALNELRQHSELVAVQIYDTLEAQLPPPGRYSVSDGHQSVVFDATDPALRNTYQQHFAQHTHTLQSLLSALSIPLLRIATHEDPYVVLSHELRVMYGH